MDERWLCGPSAMRVQVKTHPEDELIHAEP